MPRESFLILAVSLFASLTGLHAATKPSPAAKPNIILIDSDDHGWADLGAPGVGQHIRTLPQDGTPPAPQPARLHAIDPRTPQGLRELFKHTGERLGFVSAHRGGPQKNFPENCIPTFENTLRHTFAAIEINPRYTKDGDIVVHHDATLERTTTGKGLVAEMSLPELKQLRLKDADGTVTEFRIPTLDEVLEWARGKTILILDQKDVPVAARVRKIEEHKAEAYTMLIVYSFKDAQACHILNTNVMMEVMIPDRARFAEFEKTGVPWRNIVAFVGHTPPQDATLFELIHTKGTSCIAGTSRNLDRQFHGNQEAGIEAIEPEYRALLRQGADLIETDIPIPLGRLLHAGPASPSSKQSFFHRQ